MQRSRLVAAIFTGTLWSILIVASAAATCEDHFPDTEWIVAQQTDLLIVKGAEVPEGQMLRFSDAAAETARTLENDLGELPPLEVCVYSLDAEIDTTGVAPVGQNLHAAAFEDGTVAIGTVQSRLFEETAAFGLAYVSLTELARSLDRSSYPEPLATAVSHWYASRTAGKIELHHNQMRTAAFFRDPSGDGIDAADWLASDQPLVFTWNPQFHESPIGDMIEFAVATHGIAVLADLDANRWATIEQTWQAALRDEAVDGRSSGNTWLGGLAIIIGAIGLSLILASANRRTKRKARQPFVAP